MDLSKLPKLSDTKSQSPEETPASPPPVQPAPVENFPNRQGSPVGGDIWFSVVIGLLLLYLGGNFGHYAIATIAHQQFDTGFTWDSDGPGGKAGDKIAYFDLPGFTAWSEMGIFFFGLVILFEAAAKVFLLIKPGSFSRFVLMLAILFTVLGIILNLIACKKMLSVQITPLLSALAVAFGGYILFDEWATLKRMSPNAPQS